MSNLSELWHDKRNFIITAKKEIDANQFFQYLKENLRKFADHSTFLFITGHHHKGLNKSNEAIVGETDASLHASLGSEWECLKKKLGKKCKKNNKCSPQCDNCVWQKKKFLMERIFVDTNDLNTGNKVKVKQFLGPPNPAMTVKIGYSENSAHFPYNLMLLSNVK